jgi:hypothetical protein
VGLKKQGDKSKKTKYPKQPAFAKTTAGKTDIAIE